MRYTFLIVWMLGASLAFSQQAPITVKDAIELAIEKNPGVQAAKLETSRQRALKPTAFELPKTDITLMYGQYNSIQKDDNNLTIVQGIPFPTLFWKQHGLNKALTASAILKENINKHEITFQVKQLFNQLLYLKQQHELLVQQDSLLNDLARIANLQYKTGEGTLLAKTAAETQLFEVQNLRGRNRADIRIAFSHLQLLCQSNTITEVAGSLENFATMDEIQYPDSTDLSKNPSLAFSKQLTEVSNWQRKVEVARIMPDLRVGYFNQTLIGTQNINGRDQYFGSAKRFQGFQAGISFPLWFAPHTARIKAASLATEVAKKQSEAISLSITQQYNQTLQELTKNKISLEYYRSSALKTADLLEHQSRLAFKSGEIDYTSLLLNLRQVLAIREGYLLALQQYNQSIITIDYLKGEN